MSRPEIALQVKPPQTIDPVEAYGKIAGLKDMMQRGRINEQAMQLGQEQLKHAQLQNTEDERSAKADQVVRDAIQANIKIGEDGSFAVDHDKVEAMVTRAGFPDKALAYNAQRQAIENTALDHITKTLEVSSKKAKKIGQMAQTILGAPAELRPQVYSFTLKQAVSGGLVDKQQLQKQGIPEQYDGEQTDAILQQLADLGEENPYEMQLKRMTEARAAAEGDRKKQSDEAKLPGERADSLSKQAKAESELLGAARDQESWAAARMQLPPERMKMYPEQFSEQARAGAAMLGMDEKQRREIETAGNEIELAQRATRPGKEGADARAALKFLEDRDIRVESAKAAAKAAVEFGKLSGASLGGSTAKNEDALAGLDPSVAADVKHVVNYERELTPYMLTKSPYWIAISRKANDYDPNFDPSQYGTRYKTRLDFTSGSMSKAMQKLNTVSQHLARLDKSIDALNNWGGDTAATTVGNAIRNTFKAKKAQNQLAIDRDAVANELESAYRAGGGSESGVQSWKKNFSPTDSKDTQKNAVKEVGQLVEGLISSMYNQYEKSMGRTLDFNILDDKSRETYKTLGIDVDSIDPPKSKGYGDPRITEDLMKKARDANKGVDDKTLAAAIKAALDKKK